MIIEIENQVKELTQANNNRNPQQPYQVVTQPALMFKEGKDASKYPDKFGLQLFYGTDIQNANSVQPIPVGRYHLKESSFTVDSYGNARCDFSQLEPVKH